MATKPAQPPVSPQPADFDDHSGVYGFFRRHQKKLLYTAGLFTLLTFSVTGPMLASVGTVFGKKVARPTISVGGERVELDQDDYRFGEIISKNVSSSLPPVLPSLSAGKEGQTQLSEVLAILRRVAITEGIDVSMAEVDRAIEALRELNKMPTAARMAQQFHYPSLANYREVVREAMRIGTLVRLQTLALDTSDAKVIQQATNEKEKITLRVATFDEKALEDQLKAASTLSDDDLHKWLDGKNDGEKSRMGAFDLPLAELRFGALLLAEGQFDPEQWKETALKDFAISDDQLKNYYEQEKERRFKTEKPGEYKPFEDPDVKAELTRVVQAEQVMNHVLGKVREKQTEVLKPATDELSVVQSERVQAENHLNELKGQLADKPEDADIKEQIRLQEEVVDAKKRAVTAQEDAIKAARASFDFPAVFAEITRDKSGFVMKPTQGLKNAEALKDLDVGDLGLGQWAESARGTQFQNKGDLGFAPGRTTKAIILYQATDVQPRPLKPWDTLKPLVEGAYWTEQAKTQGEAKKKLMEETLLKLAKEKMPDKVTEIEGKKQSRVDEKLAEWQKKTEEGIAEAEKILAKPNLGSQAKADWERDLATHRKQLDAKDDKKKEFEAEVQKAIDTEIAAEAKKHYKEVLDAAAAQAGWTVADLEPYPRDLQRRPRFDKAYDPTVVFLFRGHSDLEEGAATDVLTDKTSRRYCVAVCTKVEPLTADDVMRRDFEMLRTGNGTLSFADLQSLFAYHQAFTHEALVKRYSFESAVGVQKVPEPEKKPEDPPK